jgi:hypothetical protein
MRTIICPPPAAKPLVISTEFFVEAKTNPLVVAYYADGAHNYAKVAIHVNGTLDKGEYKVRGAKDCHLLTFLCAFCARLFN